MPELNSRQERIRSVAGLPLFDLPQVRWANDALWDAITQRVARLSKVSLPERLEHDSDPDRQWHHPRLILSQCSGTQLVTRFRSDLIVLGTPRYSAPGCSGSDFRSAVLVRDDASFSRVRELRGHRLGINSRYSHSGCTCLIPLTAQSARFGRFFSRVDVTGSHRGSIEALRRGRVDVIAVDSVTLALMGSQTPGSLSGLRVLTMTQPAPAPAFVTRVPSPTLRRILTSTLGHVLATDPRLEEARRAVFISGFQATGPRDYQFYRELLRGAREMGYEELLPPRPRPGRGSHGVIVDLAART